MTIITDKNKVPLKDIPVDPDPPSFYEAIFRNETRENLKTAMLTLPDRLQRLRFLRFGLDDGKTHTLEEIGKILGHHREYVRALETKALRMLRHPRRLAIIFP
jgi:RNA polymerase primary sigma factor